MAINDYSFLSTTTGGGFAQTGGNAISGTYFAFTISPVGGTIPNPVVIAADDFSIGNGAENPLASNVWWGGNVDSFVQKVEFVDNVAPYDTLNTVEVRIYIFSGSTMPNSDLDVLIDVDYTTPTFNDDDDDRSSIDGRPFCIKLYTPSAYNTCVNDGTTHARYVGIASSAINTAYTASSVNPNGTGANPNCSSGFHEYKISGTVPEGQTTTIFGQSFVATSGYYFPDPGIIANLTVDTQGIDFGDAYTLTHIITRDTDSQITTYRFEVNYTPPDPAIEDLTGTTDAENITKFCSLSHSMIYSNFTPVQITSSNNGTQQVLSRVSVGGQTGVGSSTNASTGPTPIHVDGETRSVSVAGSDFAGYYLTVKQTTGATVKTLAFAKPHPSGGLESSGNTFTAGATNTGVIQLNLVNSEAGKPTFLPSGKPYAADYPKSNRHSLKSYSNPVSYHEYKVYFPTVAATTFYDIYVTSSDANESGNTDDDKENVTTSYGMSGSGSGRTSSNPIKIYQYIDPTITIQPSTNAAVNYDTMPGAVTKTGVAANTPFTGDSTGTAGSTGHVAFSFAVGADTGRVITITRQPDIADFSIISGGNGLVIYYESLAATLNNSSTNNVCTITGIAYIQQMPVDDTLINILTQNFLGNASG